MVLTQSQKQDIKSVLLEISNGDDWTKNLLEKLSQVIRKEFKARFEQQEKAINNLEEQLKEEKRKMA